MDLEEIHQGMELWKRRQLRLTPRHWQRTWLDDATPEPGTAAPVTPEGEAPENVSASSAATREDGEP